MKTRSKIFWAIWLIAVLSIIWWFAWMASGATPSIPGKKTYRQSAAVHQGAGALQLISKPKLVLKSTIPPPPLIVSALPVVTNTWFIAATAQANGLESDFSNEISFSATNRTRVAVVLAWDAPSGTNVITNYTIYFGPGPGVYTNSAKAGTNLTTTLYLIGSPPKTNLVITVTCTNGGTNIAYSTSLRGPWTKLNTNRWSYTNPPSPRYFRGIGAPANIVKISEYHY